MKKKLLPKMPLPRLDPIPRGLKLPERRFMYPVRFLSIPKTGEFAGDDIVTQTKQSLTNVKNILAEAGCSLMMSLRRRSFLRISRTLDL